MKMTNEQIQAILDGAPKGAVDFINDDYNDKEGRVYDPFEGRFVEDDYPSFGLPLATYREILELRQEVERLNSVLSLVVLSEGLAENKINDIIGERP